MSKTSIYADHAATTALSFTAREAMGPFLDAAYGNPSPLYSLAREPRKAIAHSREVIAAAINADPSEIFFTSGGTEADNWALKGTMFQYDRGKGMITSAIEHHAILNSCVALKRMPFLSFPKDSCRFRSSVFSLRRVSSPVKYGLPVFPPCSTCQTASVIHTSSSPYTCSFSTT